MLKKLDIKKEIYVNVIATILTIIFIEPILKFIWDGIIRMSAISYHGYFDSIFRSAALGYRNHVIVYVFMLLCSAIIGVSITSVLEEITERPISFEKLNKSPKLKKTLIVILYAILIISVLLLATFVFADLQLNVSFQQRLTVLAPKITEQEYKELLASWASMQSRTDYELIVSRMDTLAKQNNIILPALLLK